MNTRRYWFWCGVDQVTVLDILVQSPRDQHAAERFLRRMLEGEDDAEPRAVVADKLASYLPTLRRVLQTSEHRRHERLNNRAENSHRPVRKRERAQRFLETFNAVCNHFRPRRHRLSVEHYRQTTRKRFQQWREIARLAPAA